MTIKGIVFDVNGTLIDIHTNEWHDDVYRVIGNFLSYQGIVLDPEVIKDLYFRIIKEQCAASEQRQTEFDVVAVFREIVALHSSDFTDALSPEKRQLLPRFLAEMHRAACRMRLQLYPGVAGTIERLHASYRLAIVSDAQTAYALPELHAVGIGHYFDPIIVSGNFGYRKPDQRLFQFALDGMQLEPAEVLFVGNDLYRDIHGPQKLGIKTVYFKSGEMTSNKGDAAPDYTIHHFPELLDAVRYFEDCDRRSRERLPDS
jgi:putative hydrolase of the HAD superfamily